VNSGMNEKRIVSRATLVKASAFGEWNWFDFASDWYSFRRTP